MPGAPSPKGGRGSKPLSVAIVGAGIGGLCAAKTLLDLGHDVQVYEQARAFAPVGAGIQLTANAVKTLRPLGLEARLRAASFVAEAAYNREWNSGDVTNVLEMGARLEARYGAPDLMMHRRVLHAALAGLLPPERIHLNMRLAGLERSAGRATLVFGGTRVSTDIVIGADGIHSLVREALFGAERPRYTGRVAYRATYPVARLGGQPIDARAKWWGPDRHVVHYYTNAQRDELYFIAVTPEPDFTQESWSTPGDRDMLLAAFDGFHPQVRAILAAAPELRKWALVERDPMPRWSQDGVVLLGDACHPMMPAMAQGAASAMEDAVVLARCLEAEGASLGSAFDLYQSSRHARTARLQLTNRRTEWLRNKTDTDWVYDYDPWQAPLGAPVTDRA